MCRIKSLTTGDPNDPIVNKINQQSKELLTKSSDTGIYLYINKDSYGIVWKNVIVFTILHLLTIYATIVLIRDRVWNTWIFGEFIVKLSILCFLIDNLKCAKQMSTENQSISYCFSLNFPDEEKD